MTMYVGVNQEPLHRAFDPNDTGIIWGAYDESGNRIETNEIGKFSLGTRQSAYIVFAINSAVYGEEAITGNMWLRFTLDGFVESMSKPRAILYEAKNYLNDGIAEASPPYGNGAYTAWRLGVNTVGSAPAITGYFNPNDFNPLNSPASEDQHSTGGKGYFLAIHNADSGYTINFSDMYLELPNENQVGERARKVTKIYAGVDNVARKVKKGYVGVGGVARPFFSAEPGLEYYGTITPLSLARESLAATTVGNYALFGGGKGSSSIDKDTVDAYNISLTRSTPTVLSVSRYNLAATTVGNYALFGGGLGGSSTNKDTVDAYDVSLTRSTPTVLSVSRYNLAATTVGNYALFGGGYGNSYKDTVDAYYQEGADRIKATIRIDEAYPTGIQQYTLEYFPITGGHTTITTITTGEDYITEVELLLGGRYKFFSASSGELPSHFNIRGYNAITNSNNSVNGFIGTANTAFYISPKMPTSEPIRLSFNIQDDTGHSGGTD